MAIQNNLFESRVTLRTHVASLAGMPANAPVRLNGILIGSIDKVMPATSYDPLPGVEIDMKIYKRFLGQIPPGDKYISITRGMDPKHVDPNGEVQSVQTVTSNVSV
jgi:ABC-type transporter Mla subunit MlaD